MSWCVSPISIIQFQILWISTSLYLGADICATTTILQCSHRGIVTGIKLVNLVMFWYACSRDWPTDEVRMPRVWAARHSSGIPPHLCAPVRGGDSVHLLLHPKGVAIRRIVQGQEEHLGAVGQLVHQAAQGRLGAPETLQEARFVCERVDEDGPLLGAGLVAELPVQGAHPEGAGGVARLWPVRHGRFTGTQRQRVALNLPRQLGPDHFRFPFGFTSHWSSQNNEEPQQQQRRSRPQRCHDGANRRSSGGELAGVMSSLAHELLSFISKEGGSCQRLRKPDRTERHGVFCELPANGVRLTFGRSTDAGFICATSVCCRSHLTRWRCQSSQKKMCILAVTLIKT